MWPSIPTAPKGGRYRAPACSPRPVPGLPEQTAWILDRRASAHRANVAKAGPGASGATEPAAVTENAPEAPEREGSDRPTQEKRPYGQCSPPGCWLSWPSSCSRRWRRPCWPRRIPTWRRRAARETSRTAGGRRRVVDRAVLHVRAASTVHWNRPGCGSAGAGERSRPRPDDSRHARPRSGPGLTRRTGRHGTLRRPLGGAAHPGRRGRRTAVRGRAGHRASRRDRGGTLLSRFHADAPARALVGALGGDCHKRLFRHHASRVAPRPLGLHPGAVLGFITERAGSALPAIACHVVNNMLFTLATALGGTILAVLPNVVLLVASGPSSWPVWSGCGAR